MGRRSLVAWLALAAMAIPATSAANARRSRPLVELYTSQGCSSCPPADRLLAELADRGRVIALAFHVDYWNYIGWTDPFSSAEWSERQRRYGTAFGTHRIYTPQLVVNGGWEGVGSDRREVERVLAEARGSLVVALEIEVEERRDRLAVELRADLGEPQEGARLDAWLAITESGFETPVGSGENARLTLHNDNVVRRLLPVDLTPGRESGAAGTLEIELDPEWRREEIRLVAFLQDPETLRVLGTASARPRWRR